MSSPRKYFFLSRFSWQKLKGGQISIRWQNALLKLTVLKTRIMNKTSLTQSEHIELVLPQAPQLGVHFLFHNTHLETHLFERPDHI